MSTLKKAGSSTDWIIVLVETPDARNRIQTNQFTMVESFNQSINQLFNNGVSIKYFRQNATSQSGARVRFQLDMCHEAVGVFLTLKR